jgi:hypothetical protein
MYIYSQIPWMVTNWSILETRLRSVYMIQSVSRPPHIELNQSDFGVSNPYETYA